MTPHDRRTDTEIICNNSLHLMHSMQPKNKQFWCEMLSRQLMLLTAAVLYKLSCHFSVVQSSKAALDSAEW